MKEDLLLLWRFWARRVPTINAFPSSQTLDDSNDSNDSNLQHVAAKEETLHRHQRFKGRLRLVATLRRGRHDSCNATATTANIATAMQRRRRKFHGAKVKSMLLHSIINQSFATTPPAATQQTN